MRIGLTGQIGAGKSTAARILRSFGAVVIDADRIGRDAVNKSKTLRKQLVEKFGSYILKPDRTISRKKLARVAFATEANRHLLNELVHPHLLAQLRKELRKAEKKSDVVVVDAALLLDWKLDREMDLTLVIHASQHVRFDRLAERGIKPFDAAARQRAQLPLAEYRRRADVFILNNGSEADLEVKLRRFWNVRLSEGVLSEKGPSDADR